MDKEAQTSRPPLILSPGTPIVPLSVMVQGVRLSADGILEFFWPDVQGADREHPLGPGIGLMMPPEELYLRELVDLDLEDPEAILAFTRCYGRLEQDGWELLPKTRVEQWRHRGDPPPIARIEKLLVAHKRSDREIIGRSHLEVFRLYARILRDAVRLWTEATMSGSIRTALRDWESLGRKPQDSIAMREAAGLGPQDDEAYARHQAAKFLVEFVNPALTPYHPRFELNVEGVVWQEGVPAPALYSAMVLQLYNHIAEGGQYRRCENCKRIFVRQRDRAQQGRYRTEGRLKYCSKNCAWAAGQRKWREKQRRRKEIRELCTQGLSAPQIAERLGVDLKTLADLSLHESKGEKE